MELNLTEGEGLARELLRALPDPVVVTDSNGVIELVNDETVTVFGYQPAELIGQPVECLVPVDTRERHQRGRGAYFDVQSPLPMCATGSHVMAVRKDGSLVPVQVRVSAITLSTGRAAIAVIRDVSDRAQAQEELRISHEIFRASFEHAPIGMALIDLRGSLGRFLRVNLALCTLTGFDREALLGMTSGALTHPADREDTTAALQRLADGLGTSWDGEKRYRAASGRDIWVHQALSVIHDAQGVPAYAVSQVEDISERKTAQAQLQERFDELADNVDVGFLIRTVATAEYTYLNPAFRRFLGVDADAPAPTDAQVMAMVHPDDVERVRTSLLACSRGSRVHFDFRLTRPSGEQRWVSARFSPIVDTDGQVRRVAGLFQDITERRAHDELVKNAQAEAERANAAKDAFLSRLSHELRTPLNAVLGFGQLLQLGSLASDQEEAVNHILSGGRHLLAMINDILDVTRIDSDRMDLDIEDVDLRELVKETAGLMEQLAAANDITLGVTSDTHCFVATDRRRLKQALLNLLSNAIKYNHPHGHVQLSAHRWSAGEVRITVTDTGLGIRSEDLPRLFEPFDRLGRESSPIEGTGIGLTLTKRLVTLMNGHLDVESTPGAGSTFTITLSSAADPEPAMTAPEAADGSPHTPTAASPSTLLCIEDNPANVALLRAAVRHRPAWTLIHASTGGDGVQMATQHAPDLILLDLHLPDINSAEVLQQLKTKRATRSIPVAVLSADATPALMQAMLAVGADRYLTKPVELPELLALLDTHQAQNRTPHST